MANGNFGQLVKIRQEYKAKGLLPKKIYRQIARIFTSLQKAGLKNSENDFRLMRTCQRDMIELSFYNYSKEIAFAMWIKNKTSVESGPLKILI